MNKLLDNHTENKLQWVTALLNQLKHELMQEQTPIHSFKTHESCVLTFF